MIKHLTVNYSYVIIASLKRDRGIEMANKNMDVSMSNKTIRQQKEIKAIDRISIAKAREDILAKGVDSFHKKMFSPAAVLARLKSSEDE